MIGNYIKISFRVLGNNLLYGSLAIGGITTGLSSIYITLIEASFNGIKAVNVLNLAYSLIIFFVVGFTIHAYHEKTGNKAMFIGRTLGASPWDIFLHFLTFSGVSLTIASVLGIVLTDALIRESLIVSQPLSTINIFSAINITIFICANFCAGIIITMIPYMLAHKKSVSQR